MKEERGVGTVVDGVGLLEGGVDFLFSGVVPFLAAYFTLGVVLGSGGGGGGLDVGIGV